MENGKNLRFNNIKIGLEKISKIGYNIRVMRRKAEKF